MDKVKVTVIVEEKSGDTYKVRRAKNRTEPLGVNSIGEPRIVGVTLNKDALDALVAQGVEVIVDQPGYKRRWTP